MEKDYWQRFAESGRVEDYLAYRSSLNNQTKTGGKDEQPDNKNNGNSYKGSQDKGK